MRGPASATSQPPVPGARTLAVPAGAVALLGRVLPPADRDSVVGDLIEVFHDRAEAGRRFTRTWFWASAATFVLQAAMAGLRRPASEHRITGRQRMGRLGSGIRQAGRRLRHEWRYSLAVVLILAIGVGPAAAMLAVFERVLLRPLDYHEPDRLALLRVDLGQLGGHPGLSPAEALDLRRLDVFDAVEVETRLVEVSLGTGPEFVSLSQLAITQGMLPMLGVRPVIGRNFEDADAPPPPPPLPAAPPGQPAAPPPPPPLQRALIDHDAWQTHFGGEASVLGQVVTLNGRQTEIIGVLPPGFRLVTGRAVPRPIDVYTLLTLRDFRNAWQFPTLARLAPGVPIEAAQSALDTLSAQNLAQYPEFYQGRLRYTLLPLLDDMTRTTRPALRAAVVAVVMLLVIALANAAALVIARLRTRELDFAIRSAIGATRGALVREVLVESVLLAAGAAIAGGLLAMGAIAAIREVMPRTVPRWDEIAVGWDLLAYSAAFAFVGLVASGLLPVWKISRGTESQALRAGSVQGGRSDGAFARLVLVGAQIAVTVVLAFGCVQLVRSAGELGRVQLGYDPDVVTVTVPYDGLRHPGRDGRARIYQRIRDRVAEVPGVESVGVVTHLPLSGATMMDGYQWDLSKEPTFETAANYQAVTSGYFATMRIPVLQGREFTDQEDAGSQPVVIVDETLVRQAFPGEAEVVGRTLRLGWGLPNSRIVGVVGHARTIEVGREVRPQVYVPIGSLFQNTGHVTVRTSGDSRATVEAIVAAVDDAGAGRAVSATGKVSDHVNAALSTLVAVTGLVTALAVSAGLLSAVGLYLVIAFVVHQRRRATAIRTALGATRRQVMWQHLRTSTKVIAAAVPVGVALAYWVAPLFGDLIYGVAPRDASSLAAAIGIAVVAGGLGTWLPVRRAAQANVIKVLRES